MSVTIATDDNFQTEVLDEKDRVCLVDFWAEWCGPCRMLAPVINAVDEKYGDKVKVLKLNTDDSQKTAMDYQISSIPCVILFKEGQEIGRIVGAQSESSFVEKLKETVDLD